MSITRFAQIAAVAEGSGLIVEIFRHHDRFAHQVQVVDPNGNGSRVWLESVEGDDQNDWPPSPPIQDYSIEQRDGGDVLLAVGMAGRSHWSASFQAIAAKRMIQFEIACRLHPSQDIDDDLSRQLSSTYRTVETFDAVVTTPDARTQHAVQESTQAFKPQIATGAATICWGWAFELKTKN